MVVPWGAGEGTNNMARTIGRLIEDQIDQSVNAQNRTGANGLNAARYVLNQPADGHILWAQSAAIAANLAQDRLDFGMDEIQPLARTNQDTSWIYTNPEETGIETIDGLIDHAEDEGPIQIAGVGDVGIDPVFTNRWAQLAGIEDQIEYVSFDDAGPKVTEVVSGRVAAGHGEVQEFQSQLESGEVEILVGGLEERPDEFSDVPTTVEKGWDLTIGNFRGLLLQKGTPQEIVNELADLVSQAMETEEYKEFEREKPTPSA